MKFKGRNLNMILRSNFNFEIQNVRPQKFARKVEKGEEFESLCYINSFTYSTHHPTRPSGELVYNCPPATADDCGLFYPFS